MSVTQIKKVWKPIDGVLLLDKSSGMTSNDALQKARRLFSAAKGGHTGTLDPMATGLLPLCFGEATKFSADLLEAEKTYETDLQLGVTTDTGDAEGAILTKSTVDVSDAAILSVLPRFRGEILQTPPMHSALKKDGRPLYELARKGIEVERTPRQVHIAELEYLGREADVVRLRVRCSKGTYIRVLGEEIGQALGCGAHLIRLRRTSVANLSVAQAVTLEALQAMSESERLLALSPVDQLLQSLPLVSLSEIQLVRFVHGNPVEHPDLTLGKYRVYAGERLLGLAQCQEDGRLWPKRLVIQSEAQV